MNDNKNSENNYNGDIVQLYSNTRIQVDKLTEFIILENHSHIDIYYPKNQ